MGFFSSLGKSVKFEDPSKAAQPYLEKIPGVANQNYNPYIKSGFNSGKQGQEQYEGLMGLGPDLMESLNQLMQDPSGFLNQISQGYTKSPGYDFARDEALNAIGNAEAAGGMGGSYQHGRRAGETASNLASQDFHKYLSEALGLFGQGLEGNTGLYQTGLQGNELNTGRGFNASQQLADMLANALSSQAELAFAGKANKNANKQGLLGSGLGAIGKLGAAAIGTGLGGAVGGPVGAAAGAAGANKFFG